MALRFAGSEGRSRFWTPLYGLSAGALAGGLALAAPPTPPINESVAVEFGFVAVLTTVMSFWVVRQERGYIKLSSIGTIAAAMILPPPLALAIGATSGLASIATRPYGIRYFRLSLPMFWSTAACSVRIAVDSAGLPGNRIAGQIAVILTITTLNWVMTALIFTVSRGEGLRSVWTKTFSMFWVVEFAYFGVAGMLLANTVDGTSRGYGLAVLAALLSMALGESAAQHRHRTLLEAHLTDNTRHLAYRRAADGLVHNLRNHLAAARGYIDEVALTRQTAASRRSLGIARDACADALGALEKMGESSPRIEPRTIDASQTVAAAASLLAGRFNDRHVALRLDRMSCPFWCLGDERLIRDVLVNMLLNGIEATGEGGWVRVSLEAKKEWVEIRVADNGPGIPEDMRDRLFEPHLTTKPNGTGMGLFTSYGVIREHRGKLLYEGSTQGAVFVVQLPVAPAPVASTAPEAGPPSAVQPAPTVR